MSAPKKLSERMEHARRTTDALLSAIGAKRIRAETLPAGPGVLPGEDGSPGPFFGIEYADGTTYGWWRDEQWVALPPEVKEEALEKSHDALLFRIETIEGSLRDIRDGLYHQRCMRAPEVATESADQFPCAKVVGLARTDWCVYCLADAALAGQPEADDDRHPTDAEAKAILDAHGIDPDAAFARLEQRIREAEAGQPEAGKDSDPQAAWKCTCPTGARHYRCPLHCIGDRDHSWLVHSVWVSKSEQREDRRECTRCGLEMRPDERRNYDAERERGQKKLDDLRARSAAATACGTEQHPHDWMEQIAPHPGGIYMVCSRCGAVKDHPPCGCAESYPQTQPGKLNHGPGCYLDLGQHPMACTCWRCSERARASAPHPTPPPTP